VYSDSETGLTRNRHQLYCRKKSGQPAFRKSCAACRKAKVKCNSVLPYCGRCTEKKLICWYEPTEKNKKALVNRNGKLQNGGETAASTLPERLQVDAPETDLLEFFHPGQKYSESLSVDDISLEWDIDSGLDVDYSTISSTTSVGEHSTFTDILPFDPNFSLENCNFDFPYDLDFGHVSSLDFGNPSPELCTLEFDTPQECMFSSPYLTFRYTNTVSRLSSNSSALLTRQSPFVPTQEARLGGNPLGRNLLLETIRSYLTMLSQPGLFPPFIHHSASMATNDGNEGTPRFATMNMCRSIAMMHDKKPERHTSASIWDIVGTEQQRMNQSVSNEKRHAEKSFFLDTNPTRSSKQATNQKCLPCSRQ